MFGMTSAKEDYLPEMVTSRGFAGYGLRHGGVGRLQEIPLVAVQVFENGDGAVGFLPGRFEEFDVGSLHQAIVAPEIVGVKK